MSEKMPAEPSTAPPDMKALCLLTLFWLVARVALVAQPVMTNGFWALDLNGDESADLKYTVYSESVGSQPQRWNALIYMSPLRQSRFLKPAAARVQFNEGEEVSASRAIHFTVVPNNPLPPTESYDLDILSYKASSFDGGASWEYAPWIGGFDDASHLLLGLKLVIDTGTHYGWIRLTRPVVDLHTPFELVGYAYHPVPGEPIGAGEPPPLPPLQVQAEEGGFAFSWDPRWGELVLESTASLEPSATWAPVTSSAGGPVSVATGGETRRFFRLRQP